MTSHYLGPLPSSNVQSADPSPPSSPIPFISSHYSDFQGQSLSCYSPLLSVLYFIDDPRQYALLKIARIHFLPHDESEQFKYHVLLDHFEA